MRVIGQHHHGLALESGDVFPLSPANNVLNPAFAESKELPDFGIGGDSFHGSNLNNLPRVHNGAPAFLSTGWVNPSLCRAITHVVKLGSKKQVARIAANWIIAFVAHKKTVWNRSIFQGPSKSVSKPSDSWVTRKCNDPIPLSVVLSGVRPAKLLARFGNFWPKPVSKWSVFDFLPSSESTSESNWYRSYIGMLVFEFHSGWSLREKLFGVNT